MNTATSDEQAIRQLIDRWHTANAAGDVAQVCQLMTEDAVFLTAGLRPMRGRAAFAGAMQAALAHMQITLSGNILELNINGDWAYCWSNLQVTATKRSDGSTVKRSGDTLTILRKQPDQTWLIARYANLLVVEA